ncbi:MAG: tRNA lysidine(34) synthetase TilS [Caldilineaceae bacterium]
MSAIVEPLHPLIQSVVRAQQRYHLFPWPSDTPIPLVVGVSGGADSTCLLHVLYTLQAQWGLVLHVAHLDHALRPDSALDAAFVKHLAQQWQLPFHTQRLPDDLWQENQNRALPNESTLRTLRYRFLFTVARKVTPTEQVPKVVVAHHADDQAETVLFRLTRGAGVESLSGMAAVTAQFAPDLQEYVQIVRPLLDVRRSEIVRYLHDHKLAWREDPSNHTLTYARNRIRHQVLPELLKINPQAVEAIGRTAALLRESAARLARLDQQQLDALRIGKPDQQRVLLDLRKWQQLEAVEQRAVLHLALHELLRGQEVQSELSYEQIESVRQQMQLQQGASVLHPIVGDLVWSVVAAQAERPLAVSLHRSTLTAQAVEHPLLPKTFAAQRIEAGTTIQIGEWSLQVTELAYHDLPADWRKNPDRWRAWLDADRVGDLVLCAVHEGMNIAPLGMAGKSKSLGDFFTDRKIHPSLRTLWPLIVDQASEQILWACGLAVAHSARITESTERVILLKWQKIKKV